jgi:hypothetical protein
MIRGSCIIKCKKALGFRLKEVEEEVRTIQRGSYKLLIDEYVEILLVLKNIE